MVKSIEVVDGRLIKKEEEGYWITHKGRRIRIVPQRDTGRYLSPGGEVHARGEDEYIYACGRQRSRGEKSTTSPVTCKQCKKRKL